METERNERNSQISFIFSSHEAETIKKALKRRYSDVQRNIQRVKESPKNEGQANYIEQIKDLRYEAAFCIELTEILNDKSFK